jgi:hypothetical protein
MKKLQISHVLSAALLLLIFPCSWASAHTSAHISAHNTYFNVNIVNHSGSSVTVVMKGGDWNDNLDLPLESGASRIYRYSTHNPGIVDSYGSKYVLRDFGQMNIYTENGDEYCKSIWQHAFWVDYWSGQHDRFYLNISSGNCQVNLENNPNDLNSGLHHNKNVSKDGTYTLTIGSAGY